MSGRGRRFVTVPYVPVYVSVSGVSHPLAPPFRAGDWAGTIMCDSPR